jgi:hypothetical protein
VAGTKAGASDLDAAQPEPVVIRAKKPEA